MRHVANPIYDVVFKFLLEDERITKQFLSALLKKTVVDVHVRRNEYSNMTKAGVNLFRIDFAARVEEEKDGVKYQRVILIELQKAWVDTEILRFRQYLGVQYSNSENMLKEDVEEGPGIGIPIVAVYILGHKVGDIEEPIVYVQRQYLDYDMNPVTTGTPDPFVESLTHDSIIVQIPRLRYGKDNPLSRILKIFDQSCQDEDNRHLLHIDESSYNSNPLQNLILERLTIAAADPEVRRVMNIEDEVMGLITRRDNKIAAANEKILEQNQLIARQDEQLAHKDEQLAHKDEQIALLVKMLVQGGRTIQEISIMLGRSEDEINSLI